ncbi:MAG TPA: hypothetical protein VGN90_02460 [Pyrinomonadaceae bacterium]|jgi:hypothetical protein|nr:hypothetical protein [Pyrinomonadaceae bacterium]
MKKSVLLLVIVSLSAVYAQVFAQDRPDSGPPKVLYIVKEDIKPGMMDAHTKHSANYAGVFRTLETSNYRIALVPVAGSENEVVYITGTGSFKELEDILNGTDKKMGGASGNLRVELDRLGKEAAMLHAGMRDMFAIFRPELSFNPGIDIRTMRYFSITTTRIRPGHEAQYAEYLQKMVNIAREKAKVDSLHIAAFQIVSGAQGGTYMFFRPLRSLAELDEPIMMKVRAAMSDDMKKDADKAAGDAIMSSETSTYWFAPNMSYVEKDFAAGDPTFWNPKPETTPKPRPRK